MVDCNIIPFAFRSAYVSLICMDVIPRSYDVKPCKQPVQSHTTLRCNAVEAYGEPGYFTVYCVYSGFDHTPIPLTDVLFELVDDVLEPPTLFLLGSCMLRTSGSEEMLNRF